MSSPHGSSSFKPYMKKFEPSTFSGPVEGWSEFRLIWKVLLSDYPDSVQIQHYKSNIPVADQKRISEIQTMAQSGPDLRKSMGTPISTS